MGRKYLIFILLIIPILLTGCGCSNMLLQPGGNTSGLYNKGMHKSTDRGLSWQDKNNIQDSTALINRLNIRKIEFDVRDSRILYISTNRGFYISENSGDSWRELYGGSDVHDFVLNPKTRGIIYLAIHNKVYKTINNGNDWELIYTETRGSSLIKSLVISNFDTSQIYVLTTSGTLMLSNDWGSSWKLFYDFKSKGKKLVIDPRNSSYMFVFTDKGLQRSVDGGKNWTNIIKEWEKYFPGIRNYKDLFFAKDTNRLIYVCKYGILYSTDKGTKWKHYDLVSPAGSVDILSVAFNPQDDDELYYVVNDILYHTFDGGNNWKTKVLPSKDKTRVGDLAVDFYNSENLYIGLRE